MCTQQQKQMQKDLHVVAIEIRFKDTDQLRRKQIMTATEAVSFTRLWEFHHGRSNCYIKTTDVIEVS